MTLKTQIKQLSTLLQIPPTCLPHQLYHHPKDKTIKQIKNDPFGDVLKNKTTDVIRILFQNVGGLELSTTGHTLEVTCQSIKKYTIDIAYFAETNKNWDHPKAKKQIYKIRKQFWNEAN